MRTNLLSTLLSARVAAFDYDGTIADTFSPNPHGLDVHTACAVILDRIFGTSGLLQSLGGLCNRAPSQLIRDALTEKPALAEAGREYYHHNRKRLLSLPMRPAVQLVPMRHDNCQQLLIECFVLEKVAYLCERQSESGDLQWPDPCEGAIEFMDRLRAREKVIALISSGHTMFIERSFDRWGLRHPDVMLTDDDLRGTDWPIEKKTKPHPMLFDFLIMQAQCKGIRVKERNIDRGMQRGDIFYFGDDPAKDGIFASRADVPFGWYNPKREMPSVPLTGEHLVFHSWSELARELVS